MAKKSKISARKTSADVPAVAVPSVAPAPSAAQQIVFQPMPVPGATIGPDGLPLVPVQAPAFHATSVIIQALSTDITIVFQRAAPVLRSQQGVAGDVALQQQVAIVQMSPQALKEFSIVAAGVVDQIEKAFGPLDTEFLQQRAAKAKAEAEAKAKPKSKIKTTSKPPTSTRRH